METTNKLDEIILGRRSNFTWGEATAIYEIGEYSIVEHYPHEYINCCSTGKIDYSKRGYSCYINGASIGRGAESLDSALVCCIAYKHDGHNTRAHSYFMKMITGGA